MVLRNYQRLVAGTSSTFKSQPFTSLLQRSVSAMVKQPRASFSAFVNHRDSEDNLDQTPFEFSDENYQKIKEVMGKYPSNYKHSAVIPVLMIAQKQNNNFLTLAAMNKVAKVL